MDISGNIRRLLEEQKRPASWLADNVGITRGGLSKMFDSGVFRTDTLASIAKALGVSVTVLYGETAAAETVENERALYHAMRVISRGMVHLMDLVNIFKNVQKEDFESTDEAADYLHFLSEIITEIISEQLNGMSEIEPTYTANSMINKYGSEQAKNLHNTILKRVQKEAKKEVRSLQSDNPTTAHPAADLPAFPPPAGIVPHNAQKPEKRAKKG